MAALLISVLTPCLNRANYVRDAVESVLSQDFPSFEHIVIDGGSTDGTLEILKSYPHLRVLSEPDEGMYEALNKGIKRAAGKYITWLNTDDVYTQAAFKAVTDTFGRNLDALAVSGGVEYFKGDRSRPRVYMNYPAVTQQDFWSRVVDTPSTNGWFFRAEVFSQVGSYNPAYQYVADREFLIRVALAGIRPVPISRTLYRYRQHEDSLTISGQDSRSPQRGWQRIKVLNEDLSMLQSFLNRRDLHPAAHAAIQRSHSERSYRLAATALYHRGFKQALRAVWSGWWYDPIWPWIALKMAAKRIGRAFSNGG